MAAQPDKSVTIVCGGPHRNLKNLLLSPADGISPLAGGELVHHKVKRLLLASGVFMENRDEARRGAFRIGIDIWGSARVDQYSDWDSMSLWYINNKWPTPIDWVGFETAECIPTGARFFREAPQGHPLKLAYQNYNTGGDDLSSLQTALLAAAGMDAVAGAFSRPGKVLMTKNGCTQFREGLGWRDRILCNTAGMCAAAAERIEAALLS